VQSREISCNLGLHRNLVDARVRVQASLEVSEARPVHRRRRERRLVTAAYDAAPHLFTAFTPAAPVFLFPCLEASKGSAPPPSSALEGLRSQYAPIKRNTHKKEIDAALEGPRSRYAPAPLGRLRTCRRSARPRARAPARHSMPRRLNGPTNATWSSKGWRLVRTEAVRAGTLQQVQLEGRKVEEVEGERAAPVRPRAWMGSLHFVHLDLG